MYREIVENMASAFESRTNKKANVIFMDHYTYHDFINEIEKTLPKDMKKDFHNLASLTYKDMNVFSLGELNSYKKLMIELCHANEEELKTYKLLL